MFSNLYFSLSQEKDIRKIHSDFVVVSLTLLNINDMLISSSSVVFYRGGKYSEEDAKVVMIQILSVVAFCHLQGVVHRDLKPEVINLLMSILVVVICILTLRFN